MAPALPGAPAEVTAPAAPGEPAVPGVELSVASLQAEMPSKMTPRTQEFVAIRLLVVGISLSKGARQQGVDVVLLTPV
jgi:hypothetical protein